MSRFTDANRSPILKPLFGAVTGVGAGQTAQIKLPPGLTFADVIVRCTAAGAARTRANLEADIETVRFTVSGDEKKSITCKQHIAITEFHQTGIIGDTGNLFFPFSRLWMDGIGPKMDPNYGTDGETSVVLELKQAAGSGIDAMQVYVRLNPLAERLGAHIITRRFTFAVPGSGKFQYSDLPINPGEFLYTLHMEVPTPADLTNVAYIPDDSRMIDITQEVLASIYKTSTPNKTPQTAKGFVHLDFAARCFDTDAIPVGLLTSQVLELDFSTAVPGRTVTVLGEYAQVKR